MDILNDLYKTNCKGKYKNHFEFFQKTETKKLNDLFLKNKLLLSAKIQQQIERLAKTKTNNFIFFQSFDHSSN